MKNIIILTSILIITTLSVLFIYNFNSKPKIKNVLVIPLNDGVSESYTDSALNMLKHKFPKVNIIIGDKIKLPKSCFNGKRYRADAILKFLVKIKPDSIDHVIGLTSSDISVTRTIIRNGKKKVCRGFLTNPIFKY